MTTIFVRNLLVARAIPDENIRCGTGRLPFISEFRFGTRNFFKIVLYLTKGGGDFHRDFVLLSAAIFLQKVTEELNFCSYWSYIYIYIALLYTLFHEIIANLVSMLSSCDN